VAWKDTQAQNLLPKFNDRKKRVIIIILFFKKVLYFKSGWKRRKILKGEPFLCSTKNDKWFQVILKNICSILIAIFKVRKNQQ